MKKLILSTAVIAAFSASISTEVNAALANDAVLNFDAGVVTYVGSYSSIPVVKTGSYFGMDTNGQGGIRAAERTAISQLDGLALGTSQAAPGVDNTWSFFSNSGNHFSSSPTTVLTASGNTATVDFSGWAVTWNGIPNIPMSGGSQDCGTTDDGICTTPSPTPGDPDLDFGGILNNGTGIATITCTVDCAVGDTYTLDYAAVVPMDDPSNFGGVSYALHLEGTVGAAVPVPAAVWLFGSGLLGLVGVARRKAA